MLGETDEIDHESRFILGSAAVSFLWIVLMRWFTGPMIWISIFAVVVAIGGGDHNLASLVLEQDCGL